MRYWPLSLLLFIAILVGCARPSDDVTPGTEARTIDYYISKLPDRQFVKTYGDGENPKPWYTAAEELGQIGKPAIPALIERLETPDPYELKLALYALMLASQDPELLAETGDNYLELGSVLTEDTNEENKRRALEWWDLYQHLFP